MGTLTSSTGNGHNTPTFGNFTAGMKPILGRLLEFPCAADHIQRFHGLPGLPAGSIPAHAYRGDKKKRSRICSIDDNSYKAPLICLGYI